MIILLDGPVRVLPVTIIVVANAFESAEARHLFIIAIGHLVGQIKVLAWLVVRIVAHTV